MRKVDKLGRIVIPREMREKYGMVEGADIDFIDSGDGVTVVLSEESCVLCKVKLEKDCEIPLCPRCAKRVFLAYAENEE